MNCSAETRMKVIPMQRAKTVKTTTTKKKKRMKKTISAVLFSAHCAAGASIKSESSSSLNKSRTRNVLAGCESHIVALKDIVTPPLVNADLFKGVAPPRGALLWGPPGTGKTLLARHAAETSNATLFVVDGPELVGSVVGETEEAIREVFRAAAKAKPAIVLIDELDALCPSRGENVQNSGGSSSEGGEESTNTRA